MSRFTYQFQVNDVRIVNADILIDNNLLIGYEALRWSRVNMGPTLWPKSREPSIYKENGISPISRYASRRSGASVACAMPPSPDAIASVDVAASPYTSASIFTRLRASSHLENQSVCAWLSGRAISRSIKA